MATESSTAELVRRAQDGDRDALEELATRSRERLIAAVKELFRSSPRTGMEPDDILQETLVRALQAIGRFEWRGEGSFGAWLAGIAANLVSEAVRKKRHGASLEIVCEFPACGVSPSRVLQREERFDRLERALAGLSEDHRAVVVLARLQGLKIEEIARRLGRSTDSVRNLLFRAMQQLRRSFGDTESLGLPDRLLDQKRLDAMGEGDG